MRLVVGISGASGVIYGIRALEVARDLGIETHLVISKYGQATISLETDYSVSAVKALAHRVYSPDDLAATIASGSFSHRRHDGLSLFDQHRVRHCVRSFRQPPGAGGRRDAQRKAQARRRRARDAAPRGAPADLDRPGGDGRRHPPPMPAFYLKPSTVEEIVMHTVARVFAQFGVDVPGAPKWEGP